ncbi:MAG TPA: hypothetical protein VFA63_16185 [Pseudonocardiaceae bacterium]|nr:hypothetical protein [Pseudonocardiaceae bacterium]
MTSDDHLGGPVKPLSSAGLELDDVVLQQAVVTLRRASSTAQHQGTLEFALFSVAGMLEAVARSVVAGERIPPAILASALNIARHIAAYGVDTAHGAPTSGTVGDGEPAGSTPERSHPPSR